MCTRSRSSLTSQLQSIIHRHLVELRPFVTCAPMAKEQVPADLLESLEQLGQTCEMDPGASTPALRQEVQHHMMVIETFLEQMHQPITAEFRASSLGRIWVHGHQWLESAVHATLPTIREVRQLLSPAEPDVLEYLGNGLYEAKWWMPVPMMDIEILSRAEHIDVIDEPFEPPNLANGLGVRFILTDL